MNALQAQMISTYCLAQQQSGNWQWSESGEWIKSWEIDGSWYELRIAMGDEGFEFYSYDERLSDSDEYTTPRIQITSLSHLKSLTSTEN